MSDSATSDECIGLRPASQSVARPVAWLWPGRLPLGKLAILDGDPGVGESLVTLDLCARLSIGQRSRTAALVTARATPLFWTAKTTETTPSVPGCRHSEPI